MFFRNYLLQAQNWQANPFNRRHSNFHRFRDLVDLAFWWFDRVHSTTKRLRKFRICATFVVNIAVNINLHDPKLMVQLLNCLLKFLAE